VALRAARRPSAILALALLVIVLEPLLFAGSFAGDAQVHLVFAENAARGHFFEFNPGQHVSGETSPGYMLLGAALFRCLPARWVPVALKLLGLAGWYLLCWLVYRVAQRVLTEDDDKERFWPAAATVTAALIPGSVYNANVGMENGLFAAVVWLWIELGAHWRWFERPSSGTRSPPGGMRQEAALAGLQGVACWLRPEGFVLLGLAHLLRWRRARPPASLALTGLVMASALGLASVAFQLVSTGDIVATSILSRRVLAMQRSLALGPLLIDPAFAERLLLYLPLTVFAAIGAGVRAPERTGLETFLLTVFAAFFIVYTFGSGAAHLARYVIFVMPIVALYAVRGVREVWRWRRRGRRSLVALGALVFIVTSVAELAYRRSHYSLALLANAMAAPSERRARTDDLLRRLEAHPGSPLVVAVESIESRYEVDGRIVVRSLDGRVDRQLFGFVRDGTVDHYGYLRELGVDALVGTADYNRRDREGSLVSLGSLRPGQSVVRAGLRFRRLPLVLGFSISPSGAPDHER
jgi:hypothetical protein